MASNTFYATACTNSSVNGLLNGGEDSWDRSATTSWNVLNLGYFTYNMNSIRNTIPSVAKINSVEFSIDIKQSRSNGSLYQTSIESQLFVGNTAKSDKFTSGTVTNSYEQKIYGNTVAITSSELYNQDLKVFYGARYKGTLKTTQYAKNLYCRILWEPINTTSLSINKTSITLKKDEVETLNVTRTPASVSYPTITWNSSNTNVAIVNSNGVVTAISEGNCTITATSLDSGIKVSCEVVVKLDDLYKISKGNVIVQNMMLGTLSIKNAYIGTKQILRK